MTLVQILGWLLILVGIVGAVLPMLPGPALVWLGAFLLAWADGFHTLGVGTLALLFALTLLAAGAQWLAGTLGARTQGASWLGVIAGIVGAVVGLILGNLPGLLIGGVLGIFLVEWGLRRAHWKQALRGSIGYVLGYFLGTIGQVLITLIMVAIIISQTVL